MNTRLTPCRIRLLMAAVAALALAGPAVGEAADGPDVLASRSAVVAQVSAGKAFSYKSELRSTSRLYCVYRFSYPSPMVTSVAENNTIPGDYYLPSGIGPDAPQRPAVICLHILNGNFELEQITCATLASRGIPAIMIKLPYYGERSPPGGARALLGNPRLFVEALPQGIADVRRTVDVLASRAEVNPARIGIVGISLGGILAATAAESDSRFCRAALILAGGDLGRIVAHARETRELSQFLNRLAPGERSQADAMLRTVDPLEKAGLLRDRAVQGKVMMINAAEDEVIPRECTERLAAALGISERVVWLQGVGHYTALAALPQTLVATADFFAQDLPPGTPGPSPAPAADPLQTLALLVQQAAALAGPNPAEGHGHFADLAIRFAAPGQKPREGTLRVIRGSHSRFRIEARLPGVGQLVLGQGRYPWMAAGDGKLVYRGTASADPRPGNPLAYADLRQLRKLQAVVGTLGSVALAPQILETLLSVSDDTGPDGLPALRVTLKNHRPGSARIVMRKDRSGPESIRFQMEDLEGTILFRNWQIDTVALDAIFEEPPGCRVQDVDAEDLRRMFAAMFDFALEHLP